jgi:branched-chain amino acid transport system permease protein
VSGRNAFGLVAAGGIAVAVVPFFISSGHVLDVAVVGTYTIAILGLGQLLGPSGRISLGQGAFMALGGYTTAILCAHHGVGQLWTLPAAALVAGVAGAGAGLFSLRLGALSPGIVTLGLALVVPDLAVRFASLTGGAGGLALPDRPFGVRQAYAVTWIVAGVLFLLAWRLTRGRGRGRDLSAAASFGLSGAYAGVAGSLLVINIGSVGPGTFPLRLSLLLLAGAAIAGLGSVWGAPLAALLIRYLSDLTGALPHVGSHRPGPTTFLFGLAVILLVVGRGMAASVNERFRRAGP